MKIHIVWGKGEGKTTISAFDKSLIEAGIHNFNLIPLSSVIPPGAVVCEPGVYKSHRNTGDILYVVISSFSSNKPKTRISAGLGWVQTKEGGVLFESQGECSPEDCQEEIKKGLEDIMLARGWSAEIRMKIMTREVREIANVTVAAVYDFDA